MFTEDKYVVEICNKEEILFSKITDLLNTGYKVSMNLGTIYVLTNGKEYKIFSLGKVKINKFSDIYKYYTPRELVLPNNQNNYINIINSIKASLIKNKDKSNLIVDDTFYTILNKKKFDHIVTIVLDGLSSKILDEVLPNESFLKINKLKDITSIYPSTTAAATTSITTGKYPLETGMTGWENYIPEFNKNICLLTGMDYITKKKVDDDYKKYFKDKSYFSLFPSYKSLEIYPDFSNIEDIKILLDKALHFVANNKKSMVYLYYPEPDGKLHNNGLSIDTENLIKDINYKIEEFSKYLPVNTLLIVTADHGHKDVKCIKLYEFKYLYDMLNKNPSNDTRCVCFSVKKDKKHEFYKLFNSMFSSIYKLYTKDEFIEEGFLGIPTSKKHKLIKDFIADFIAVAINDYYFAYTKETPIDFVSHHAGITKEEMIIPLIKFER